MALDLKDIFGWQPPKAYVYVDNSVKTPIWDGRRNNSSPPFISPVGYTSKHFIDTKRKNCTETEGRKNVDFHKNLSEEEKDSIEDTNILKPYDQKTSTLQATDQYSEGNGTDSDEISPSLNLTPLLLRKMSLQDANNENNYDDKDNKDLSDKEKNQKTVTDAQKQLAFRKHSNIIIPTEFPLQKDLSVDFASLRKDSSSLEQSKSPNRKPTIIYKEDCRKDSIHFDKILKDRRKSSGPTFLSVSHFKSGNMDNENSTDTDKGKTGFYLKRVKEERKELPDTKDTENIDPSLNNGNNTKPKAVEGSRNNNSMERDKKKIKNGNKFPKGNRRKNGLNKLEEEENHGGNDQDEIGKAEGTDSMASDTKEQGKRTKHSKESNEIKEGKQIQSPIDSEKSTPIYWNHNIPDVDSVSLASVLAHRRQSRGAAFVSLSFQDDTADNPQSKKHSAKNKSGGLYLRGSSQKKPSTQ